jgi:hypothetical protein
MELVLKMESKAHQLVFPFIPINRNNEKFLLILCKVMAFIGDRIINCDLKKNHLTFF